MVMKKINFMGLDVEIPFPLLPFRQGRGNLLLKGASIVIPCYFQRMIPKDTGTLFDSMTNRPISFISVKESMISG